MSRRLIWFSLVFSLALLGPAANAVAQYDRVPVRLRNIVAGDASFAEFQKKLRQAAEKRDLKAIENLVATTFFWERDFGGGYNRAATPFQNLVNAMQLDDSKLRRSARGIGWRKLQRIAGSRHFAPSDADKPVTEAVCGPAPPGYQSNAIKNDDLLFWGYVFDRAPVRAAASPQSKIIRQVENEAIKVETWATRVPGRPKFVKVELPDGKSGYIAEGQIQPFLDEQLCFRKLGNGWRIVGYIGGGD